MGAVTYEDDMGTGHTISTPVSHEKSVTLCDTDETHCKVESVLECPGCDNLGPMSIFCEVGEFIVIKSALKGPAVDPGLRLLPCPTWVRRTAHQVGRVVRSASSAAVPAAAVGTRSRPRSRQELKKASSAADTSTGRAYAPEMERLPSRSSACPGNSTNFSGRLHTLPGPAHIMLLIDQRGGKQ